MADISEFSTSDPTDISLISDFPQTVRELATAFKERFELDHNFSGELSDDDVDCDGYHKQLTMPAYSGIDSSTGNPITEPENINHSNQLFVKNISIDVSKKVLCVITSGSPIITTSFNFNGILVGANVSGLYIPSGTTVISVDSPTQLTLSNNATGSYSSTAQPLSFSFENSDNELFSKCYNKSNQITSVGYKVPNINLFESKSAYAFLISSGYPRLRYIKYLSLYILVGTASSVLYLYSSVDLENWTLRFSYSGSPGNNYHGFEMIDNLFIIFANNGYIHYSTDLITWGTVDMLSNGSYGDSAYCNDGTYIYRSEYYGVDYSYNGITYRSSNGITWTPILYRSYESVIAQCFGNSLFIIITRTSGGSYKLYTSSDSISLSLIETLSFSPSMVYYANGKYIITGQGLSTLYISSDGASWSLINIPLTMYISDIIYEDCKYIFCGFKGSSYCGIIMTSNDLFNFKITEYETSNRSFTSVFYRKDYELSEGIVKKIFAFYNNCGTIYLTT